VRTTLLLKAFVVDIGPQGEGGDWVRVEPARRYCFKACKTVLDKKIPVVVTIAAIKKTKKNTNRRHQAQNTWLYFSLLVTVVVV
jgi:hypothetical protein